MTHKQRILAACRGDVPDRIPWVPRMDLWHNAHSRAGTLPEQFKNATLREITDAIGVGYHAVIPNFLDVRSLDDTIDRLLGIFHLKTMAYDTRLSNVEREVGQEDDFTRVTYHTPQGSVSGTFGYTDEMEKSGVSISWIGEHILKGPDDYPVLEHIFSNLEVIPTYDNFSEWQKWVGDDGVAVACGNFSASPLRHIMRDFMPMTQFFLEMHDRPDELASLARSMEPWFDTVFETLVQSPAEIILLGSNYDESITYPPFFEEHILPWLSRFCEMAHKKGKLVLTHTDGENEGLLELYRRSSFDIADSLCPAPMTKLTLARAMQELPGVTIWGGIPSIAFCEDSMSEDEFDRVVDEVLQLAHGKSHIILGIADTMPPNASFERVLKITEQVNS